MKSITLTRFIAFIFSIVFLALLQGCTSNNSSVSKQAKVFSLTLEDSITFDRLSEVELQDYNENTGELLLHDAQTSEILIINTQGELVSSFDPFTEGPNYVSDQTYGWNFYGEDQILAYGQVHFHRLSKKGQRIQRLEYPVEVSSWWTLDYNPRMLFTFDDNNESKIVAFIPGVTGPNYKTQAFQDSVDMVYTLSFESSKSQAVFEKLEQSVYRSLGKYVDRGWPTMANFSDSRFAVTYSIDSVLYIFDAVSNELLNQIPIPRGYQPKYDYVDFGSKNVPDRSRINTRIFPMGEEIILEVSDRIPESVMTKIQQLPQWWESDELMEASRKYSDRYYLVFNQNGYLGNLNWQGTNINYHIIGSKNGFLWLQRRYEDERDYRTFLKMKITEELN